MTVSQYLDSVVTSEGSSVIMFAVSINGKRKRISSGVKCFREAWDKKNKRIKKHLEEPFYQDKNAVLQIRFACFKKIESHANLNHIELTHELVKEMYQELTKPQNSSKNDQSLIEEVQLEPEDIYTIAQVSELVKDRFKNRYSKAKTRQFKQVIDAVNRFDPGAKVKNMTDAWLTNYCDFLVSEDKENNTIKFNHLKNLKVIYRHAKEKLGLKISDDIESFSWKENRKQHFTPSAKDIDLLLDLNEITGTMEHVRDAFIVSCFTGLRESDLKNLSFEMIDSQAGMKYLRISMQKTDLDYSIPIAPQVWEILTKYNFKIPTYTQQNYNLTIKKVAAKVIKGKFVKHRFVGNKKIKIVKDRYQMFTSHSGRRFFGRNWVDQGGSIFILMRILGHTTVETTLRYIGYQPQEITNEFKKIIMAPVTVSD